MQELHVQLEAAGDTVAMMIDPRLRPLMRLSVDVGDVVTVGAVAQGERRVVAIDGGSFDNGDGWCGVVLPGGADWQLLRSDGVLEVDARYVLQDSRGARVQVTSRGLRHGPLDLMAALARGDAVDPALYYFRTAMRFETAADDLQHLNRLIAVAVGAREARCVQLDVFALR
jgi:hypothetical protein